MEPVTQSTEPLAGLRAEIALYAGQNDSPVDLLKLRSAADEIERLRQDLGLARMRMRNIRDNAKGSETLSPEQARWKLKIIHEMLEGWT
jgi:hypothetical protein